MKVFVTGATGFIGSVLVGKLRGRGDDVVIYVRNTGKAKGLVAAGCEVVEGSLVDSAALVAAMAGADAVIHVAGAYEVGIPASARPAMYETNVTGTERVLDAAIEAGVPRVVYVSTVNALGNTHGTVGDETTRHHGDYVSYYDETKHLAHVAAEQRIGDGAPIIIVQPGMVYGPGDRSSFGAAKEMFLKGRMPAMVLPETGISAAHVEDVSDGIVAALDKGRLGESYVLSGDILTMRQYFETLAEVAGKKPPRRTVPTGLLRAIAPLGPVVGPAMGVGPNLREIIAAGDGVTYWARHDKATEELGYEPRPFAQGLKDTLAAEGRL